ncbi:MAG: hypothetical protein EA380_01825 [Phycisphaeraceae bacterium]|nr:MAG: hypothetical protein EA380_01825 [Phycisphaeraceae bacterium]
MIHAAPTLIAWRPFLDPLDLHTLWWLTLIPMALFVAMAYKAVRLPELDDYWRSVAVMTAQIVLAMIALAAALHLIIEFVVPLLSR